MGYFSDHDEGCTPFSPCRRCLGAEFLKKELRGGEGAFQRYLEILEGTSKPAPPISPDDPRLKINLRSESSLRRVTANALYYDGFVTVGDVLLKTRSELWRVPGLGRRTVDEIEQYLTHLGLSLRP